MTLIGPNTTLLDNQGIKDMGVTEAPSLVKTWDGKYVLFFSHDCYNTPNYTVSYATSDQITGPYKRRGDLFKTGVDGLNGPGGATIHWDMVNVSFPLTLQPLSTPFLFTIHPLHPLFQSFHLFLPAVPLTPNRSTTDGLSCE